MPGGGAPTSSAARIGASAHIQEVQRLYSNHNPRKLADIPVLIEKYGEDKLLLMVQRKYGATPSNAAEPCTTQPAVVSRQGPSRRATAAAKLLLPSPEVSEAHRNPGRATSPYRLPRRTPDPAGSLGASPPAPTPAEGWSDAILGLHETLLGQLTEGADRATSPAARDPNSPMRRAFADSVARASASVGAHAGVARARSPLALHRSEGRGC